MFETSENELPRGISKWVRQFERAQSARFRQRLDISDRVLLDRLAMPSTGRVEYLAEFELFITEFAIEPVPAATVMSTAELHDKPSTECFVLYGRQCLAAQYGTPDWHRDARQLWAVRDLLLLYGLDAIESIFDRGEDCLDNSLANGELRW